LVSAARGLAYRTLEGNIERWRHSAGVAARAAELTGAVAPGEESLLVAAAWLHDIGYAERLRDTGFHPLDGARYLRSTGWHPTLCNMVANHSGSRFVAVVLGLEEQMGEFSYDENPVSDALTIADQTIGPNGRSLSLEERMREMLQRHGPDSPSVRAHHKRAAYLRAASQRVNRRLRIAETVATGRLDSSLPEQADGPTMSIEQLHVR